MKFVIAIAAALAVASAQFNAIQPTLAPYYQNRNPYQSSTPFPFVTSQRPPLPVVNRVINNEQDAKIIRYDSDSAPDGSFAYVFDTDNGISVEANGTPRDFGGNPPVAPVVMQGRYTYTSPEGQVNTITYIADENGYQPQGDGIPTPPPIPLAILKSLEFIARNPPKANK